MRIKEDLTSNHESLLAVIKAANTDTTIQYENGAVCKVTIDNLDNDAKTKLLGKIDSVGIDFFYITSGIRNKNHLSSRSGLFSYKKYEINVYSLIGRDSVILFKDKSSIRFTLNITSLFTDFPQIENEERAFNEAGGEITTCICSIM